MENKTTTELLDLLAKVQKKEPYDGDKVEEIFAELRQREPFFTILNPDFDESLPYVLDMVKDLQEEVKKLKRHKHDEKTGDVMVRV